MPRFICGGAVGVDIGSVNGGAFGSGVAVGVKLGRGVGVVLGRSNRPRRCDGVGEVVVSGVGVDVELGASDAFGIAILRGVVVGVCNGVADAEAAADAIGVEVPAGVSERTTDSPLCGGGVPAIAALVNFFGGTLGGGVASDFIFWRAFFASS